MYYNQSLPTSTTLNRASLPALLAVTAATTICCLVVNARPTESAALVSLAAFVLLAILHVELGVAASIGGVILVGGTWSSIGLSGIALPIIATALLLGYFIYSLRFGFRIGSGPIPLLVLLLGFVMIAGLAYTPATGLGVRRTLEYFLVNILLFGVALFNHDLRVLLRLLWGIVAFGFLIAVISYGDIVFMSGLSSSRYSIAQMNPIWYARTLGLTLIVFLALTSDVRNPAFHVVKWLLVAGILQLIFWAASRGPLVATLISTCAYLYLVPIRRLRHVKVLPIVLFVLFIALIYIAIPKPETTARLTVFGFNPRDVSTLQRFQAFAVALSLFVQHPLFGIGTAGFSEHLLLRYPHNIILEAACEYGLVGLSLLVGLFAALAIKMRQLSRRLSGSPPAMRLLRCFSLILLFAFLNAMVSGSITGNSWIWLAAGGVWALHLYSERTDAKI